MKKKFLISIISIIIVLIAICSYLYFNRDKGITGKKWVEMQDETIENLQNYCKEMDDVYALYTIQAMTESDFNNELSILKTEYNYIYSAYMKLKNDNPVKAGTHSYASKRTSESIDNIFTYIANILDESTVNGKVKSYKEVSYIYLAYKEQISDALYDYLTTMTLYNIDN